MSLFLGLMEMFFYIAVYLFVASQWIRLSNLFLVCCVVQEKPFRMVYKLLLIE